MEVTRPQVFFPPEGAEVRLSFPPSTGTQWESVRLRSARNLKITVEPLHREDESTTGYETKPDTKDPNYRYKVLAQTLAANVHNDKLSDAAFRQFVTNCVQEFIPPRDASMAVAYEEQLGAKKEVQMQLRTDIWQFKGCTVYKLQSTGRRGDADQFQNEYMFRVEYIPAPGNAQIQEERALVEGRMAQYISQALNGWGTSRPAPIEKTPNIAKFKAFEKALNELCTQHGVVLQTAPVSAELQVRDATEVDFDIGAPPTYLASLKDATEYVEASDAPQADLLDSGNHGDYSAPVPHNGLGYCPVCGCPGKAREKRPDGDDICKNNHRYPSATAEYPAKGGSNDPA